MGSLVELVIALNKERRHLSLGQRLEIAARALPQLQDEAKKRMGEGGAKSRPTPKEGTPLKEYLPLGDPTQAKKERLANEATTLAAKAVGVSRNSLYGYRQVKKADPELAEAGYPDFVAYCTGRWGYRKAARL